MIADAGAVPRQNSACADWSLPVRRQQLVMLAAVSGPPRHLPRGILQLLRKGKVQEQGQRAAACPFLFPVVIPHQNSDDKGLPPCWGGLLQLNLPEPGISQGRVCGEGLKFIEDSVPVLMHTNVSENKHDLFPCVNLMHYQTDATNMHKSSAVFRYERWWSAPKDAILILCEFQKCCSL